MESRMCRNVLVYIRQATISNKKSKWNTMSLEVREIQISALDQSSLRNDTIPPLFN